MYVLIEWHPPSSLPARIWPAMDSSHLRLTRDAATRLRLPPARDTEDDLQECFRCIAQVLESVGKEMALPGGEGRGGAVSGVHVMTAEGQQGQLNAVVALFQQKGCQLETAPATLLLCHPGTRWEWEENSKYRESMKPLGCGIRFTTRL